MIRDLIGAWSEERCPECEARLLSNKVGDKWCSFINCSYGLQSTYGMLTYKKVENHFSQILRAIPPPTKDKPRVWMRDGVMFKNDGENYYVRLVNVITKNEKWARCELDDDYNLVKIYE